MELWFGDWADLKPEWISYSTSKERQVCVYALWGAKMYYHQNSATSQGARELKHWSPSITLYRKFDLCIPKNETARPHSQFLHSCICERFMYSPNQSAFLPAKISRPMMGIYKSLTDIWMWKLGCHAVSFLGTYKSGPNIYIGFSQVLHLQCASVLVSRNFMQFAETVIISGCLNF